MLNESVEGFAERLNAKVYRLIAVLILAGVVLGSFRPVMDNTDLGWHVAQGRWMVTHGAIYRHDVLNYPNLGHGVIDEYPLFQVILFAAWSLGWWGPCVLTAIAYTALVGVLIRAGWLFHRGASALCMMGIAAMLLYLQVAYPLRPHVVTYLGVVILGIFLLRHREEKSWVAFWPMALLQIAWVNSHSAFVLGPAMVAFFGLEMTARHWIRERAFPQATARTWLGAFVLILLACFVNPYGWSRFYLPFYQDQLESIRAYVGEMEPLGGGLAALYIELTAITACLIVVNWYRRGLAISYSFVFLAVAFYLQAQSVQKAWPIMGLFVPLMVLSSAAFSSRFFSLRYDTLIGALGQLFVAVVAGVVLYLEFDPTWPRSLPVQWREYDRGRSEQSVEASAWMKTHGIDGRLFHRCEDGGWLQEEGFDQGETFADTGFGKYDEAFIHEVGLVNERPGLVQHYLGAYQPDYVVCSTFCYQWPFYVRQGGWRLIFYSPNSSVWTRPGTRPDLATLGDASVIASFTHDLSVYGRPVDIRLFGRNLIALHSLGLEDFTFTTMTDLPAELHHASWYWEAARFICFAEPAASVAHRNAFLREADQLHDAVTAEFRAYAHDVDGDVDGALAILETIPKDQLSNASAELLCQIYLDRKRPEALVLARRTDCWDLRNGRHWQYLAQAEEQAGHPDAAAVAWGKAVFYYPDDPSLIARASAFAARYSDEALAHDLLESARVYGQ